MTDDTSSSVRKQARTVAKDMGISIVHVLRLAGVSATGDEQKDGRKLVTPISVMSNHNKELTGQAPSTALEPWRMGAYDRSERLAAALLGDRPFSSIYDAPRIKRLQVIAERAARLRKAPYQPSLPTFRKAGTRDWEYPDPMLPGRWIRITHSQYMQYERALKDEPQKAEPPKVFSDALIDLMVDDLFNLWCCRKLCPDCYRPLNLSLVDKALKIIDGTFKPPSKPVRSRKTREFRPKPDDEIGFPARHNECRLVVPAMRDLKFELRTADVPPGEYNRIRKKRYKEIIFELLEELRQKNAKLRSLRPEEQVQWVTDLMAAIDNPQLPTKPLQPKDFRR